MLSIGKLVAGQQRYYEQQVAQGRDDYYSGRGEAPGEWVGTGARALGLEGRVSANQFNALIAGSDPRDPSRPLRDGPPPKVAALDLTFSAPKSVSVLFAIVDEHVASQLVDAHEDAVRAALHWLEETAVEVRRGPQGRVRQPGDGLIAAAYRHRMSRALDPQLHTHVVAANLTRGPDNRFTALSGTPLYRAAKTAGYLYQAHLRAGISDRLGLQWGPVTKGAGELKGVPRGALEAFSRRRRDMQRSAAEGGFSLGTKRSAEAAAIDTRDRKRYGIETHTWREEVQSRAAEHGLGRSEVAGLVTHARSRLARGDRGPASDGAAASHGDAAETFRLAERLAGEHGLTERSNTFDGRAVLQEFAQGAGQGARVAEVRGRADRFVDRTDVLRTRSGELTTADLVSCERRLIDSALGRADTGCAVIPERKIVDALGGGDRPLTNQQHDVVQKTASSGHGVQVIEALAGTGKTYIAGALRSVYEAAGYRVAGLAPTGRAARELTEEAGIPASTIDRALIDIDHTGTGFAERTVIVLDEAGMAPTRLTARLLEHAARAGAKVIAIGDSRQLPSVLAGGWLRAIGDRVGTLRLTEVMRQRDPEERRALGALHEGLPSLYLEWAESQRRVDVVPADCLAERALEEWIPAEAECGPARAVMISRDNDTRARLNESARVHCRATGRLGEEHVYGRTAIAVGDRVICRNNDARVGVDNGTRGTVRHVDPGGALLETDAGVTRELPADYVADHVEHAYCLTGHGMQGATVERALVVAAPEDLTAGWGYSALSRARGATRLLIADTDRHDAARAEHAPSTDRTADGRSAIIARAARRMLVRDDEDLAVDQLPPDGRRRDRGIASGAGAPAGRSRERAAERADASREPAGLSRLIELREQTERLLLELGSLPTMRLARLETLEAKVRALTARLSERHERLAGLDSPKRRAGRIRDPNAEERAFLRGAIELDGRELAHLNADLARVASELGGRDQIRSERDRIERALAACQREHDGVRELLAREAVERRPEWLQGALGERPAGVREREAWDRAARALAEYRLDHDVVDEQAALGPEPAAGGDRNRAWHQARSDLERAQQRLGSGPADIDRAAELGIG